MKIYFDMDGTFVDFYGVDGWLDDLNARNPHPYYVAKPLFRMSQFARLLNALTAQGHEICIVSWLARNSTEDFDRKVTVAKLEWLKDHLPSVQFAEIHILPYGTPKSTVADETCILFDDEIGNRNAWVGTAYEPNDIFDILRGLKD